ncbi:MAG TPA: isoprenylcysteine carboxylmethyltransferase family protein [Xanthobacteraceae bacterium]|nr:isoprenylcysteine carboxylmethyltransferase family protein [Xanthobacteraceae bacterium]
MPDWLAIAPFAVLWLGWLTYWMVAARDVKTTSRREGAATFLLNRVFVVIGALLLVVYRQPLHWLNERFVAPGLAAYFLGLVMVAAGLGFAVWARVYLGRNWSAIVTVKQDHELIRTGPYGRVRHPIYSGLLLALLGTAVGIDEWRGLVAFASFTIGFLVKIKAEERFMSETFGEQYARYRAEVPALIPLIGRSRASDNAAG